MEVKYIEERFHDLLYVVYHYLVVVRHYLVVVPE
jgi:hypothetical protein